MIYNPFLQYTQLSNFIINLRISSNSYSYADRYTMTVTSDASGVNIVCSECYDSGYSNKLTDISGLQFDDHGVLDYRGDDLLITMQKPAEGLTFAFRDVEINPCVVDLRRGNKPQDITKSIQIKVKTPLSCKLDGNKIILELLSEGESQVKEYGDPGLMRINGISPDDGGNLTIVSKSPEITITTANPEDDSEDDSDAII